MLFFYKEETMKLLDKLKKAVGSKGKALVLSEKPAQAMDYANVLLKDKRISEGYIEGDKYIITWTIGHLCTLYYPEDYKEEYKTWRYEDLPIIPNGFWIKVRNESNRKAQVKIIKELINREDVTSICIGTDAGREGQLLADYVLMLLENKKPVFRLWVDALTEKDIRKGFNELKPADFYEDLSEAAKARDEVDWLMGYNFSRLFSLLDKETHSVGRCSAAVLNIIVERENLIQKFQVKDYYQLQGEFISKGVRYSGVSSEQYKTLTEAESLLKKLKSGQGSITEVSKYLKEVEPPELINLADLQVNCFNRYGYEIEDTYNLAQLLYEKKFITYPRTDCRRVKGTQAEEFKDIINMLSSNFSETDKVDKENLKITKRIVDDAAITDHTAIIPVLKENFKETYSELNDEEKNVYKEVVLSFIGVFLDSYKYESYKVITEIEDIKFISNEKNTVNLGWKAIFNSKDKESDVKKLLEGDAAVVEDIIVLSKSTRPPKRLSSAELLMILENPTRLVLIKELKDVIKTKGIGTSATRTNIINDLIKNGYVLKDKGLLVPTQKGIKLITLLGDSKIKNVDLTADIEFKLQQIQEGKFKKDQLVKEIIDLISDSIKQHESNFAEKEESKTSKVYGVCPLCNKGKVVKAGDKGYGCTDLKTSGCRFFVASKILGVVINETEIKNLANKKSTSILEFKGPKGNFKARVIWKDGKTKFQYVKGGN